MGGTTGVGLEQGLGLMDISRGRPGRRPGEERSSLPDYYFIVDKINPSSPGARLAYVTNDNSRGTGMYATMAI